MEIAFLLLVLGAVPLTAMVITGRRRRARANAAHVEWAMDLHQIDTATAAIPTGRRQQQLARAYESAHRPVNVDRARGWSVLQAELERYVSAEDVFAPKPGETRQQAKARMLSR